MNLSIVIHTNAQNSFPERCIGTWKGTMYIYNNGVLKDSVDIRFTVSKTKDANVYTWKTEYLSEKLPLVKAYKLRTAETEENTYLMDEGNGIRLKAYVFGNKLYSIFETSGIVLTSSYELIEDRLVFEVTSGRKLEEDKKVTSYSVKNLQSVILRRIK